MAARQLRRLQLKRTAHRKYVNVHLRSATALLAKMANVARISIRQLIYCLKDQRTMLASCNLELQNMIEEQSLEEDIGCAESLDAEIGEAISRLQGALDESFVMPSSRVDACVETAESHGTSSVLQRSRKIKSTLQAESTTLLASSTVQHSATLSRFSQSKSADPRHMKCVFCNGKHTSCNCNKFPTTESRRKLLEDRCLFCLNSGHHAASCPSKQPCRFCKRSNHNSALCFRRFGGSSTKDNYRPHGHTKYCANERNNGSDATLAPETARP
jgi:hypothetical protein